MTRRTSTTNKRGRKERLLRYLLRRKPCAIITVVEVSLFVVLGILLAVLVFFNRGLDQQLETLRREDAVLQNYSQKVTFLHCNYEKPKDFNTDFCKNRCGKTAFMWRHHKLITNNETLDKTCLDRHEQIDCMPDNYECKQPFKSIPQCGGLFKFPMPTEMITSEFNVTAPLINVSNHIGEILLAQEIFVLCPRCRVMTNKYKNKNKDNRNDETENFCRRSLHTVRQGWPYRMALCDGEETFPNVTDCEVY